MRSVDELVCLLLILLAVLSRTSVRVRKLMGLNMSIINCAFKQPWKKNWGIKLPDILFCYTWELHLTRSLQCHNAGGRTRAQGHEDWRWNNHAWDWTLRAVHCNAYNAYLFRWHCVGVAVWCNVNALCSFSLHKSIEDCLNSEIVKHYYRVIKTFYQWLDNRILLQTQYGFLLPHWLRDHSMFQSFSKKQAERFNKKAEQRASSLFLRQLHSSFGKLSLSLCILRHWANILSLSSKRRKTALFVTK